MRILYSAIDQSVPAPHGGSVHVTSVAEGLSALGHEVHVIASPGNGGPPPPGEVVWWPMSPPLGDRRLRLFRARQVIRRARSLRPDIIIERYYNFGGEGLLAAREVGAVGVLEVNAPVVDYPGSAKQWIDRLMIVQPLRRWRNWQCAAADLIVTPSARILPDHVPAARVLETEWGADTDRFHPGATGVVPFARKAGETVVVFVGAFRPWHGAAHLVQAIRELRARGRSDIRAVLIGDGPELGRVRQAAEGLGGVTITGALPHGQIPGSLAAADAGVAPFDVSAHAPLQWEFYWSPLKIFEYMASGLPVVAPRIERLGRIFRDGREGLFYDPAQRGGLAAALERIADPVLRSELGAAARARVVEHFSWRNHCQALDRAIRAAHDAHSHRH
jgi:glycosyltransferase involved in cell wall biosynthesis